MTKESNSKGEKLFAAMTTITQSTSFYGCYDAEEVQLKELDVANKIVSKINDLENRDFDVENSAIRNITKTYDNNVGITTFYIVTTDKKTQNPYFLEMKFSQVKDKGYAYERIISNFSRGFSNYTMESYKANKTTYSIIKGLVEISGKQKNNLIDDKTRNGLGSVSGGVVNSINVVNIDKKSNKLSFEAVTTLRNNHTFMVPMYNYGKIENVVQNDVTCIIKNSTITVDLTDEYLKNPLKSIEDYLSFVKSDTVDVNKYSVEEHYKDSSASFFYNNEIEKGFSDKEQTLKNNSR